MAVGAGPGTTDELPYNAVAARGIDYTLLAAAKPPTTSTAWNAIRLMEPNNITVLTAAIDATQTTITVASSAGIIANDTLQIDSEQLQVTLVAGTTLTVVRGANSTTAAAHASGATVYDLSARPVTPNPNATMTLPNFIQLPYQRSELLRKIFNNLTTRSNVYGVWLTVGYFQVTNDTVRPVQLGAEIGKAENRQVRHHMFAIVDRTNLQIWPTIDPNATTAGTAMVRASAAITLPTQTNNNGPGGVGTPTTLTAVSTSASIALINSGGTAITSVTNPYTNYAWTLGAGQFLTYDPDTDNEETVVVQGTPGSYTATFYKSHLANCTVISRGNPGPWARYDPRNDTGVVPYFTVID
jgi:hypothetical protein